MIMSFMNKKPVFEEDIYISETSVIIGEVTLKKNANIWFGAVLRGDADSIVIGENTNIQENTVVHVDENKCVKVGNGCTIGHGAIIHGCKIGNNTLIGMGAIILNGVEIGNNSIVGAGSLVTQNKKFEDGVLIIGNPAKVVRNLTEEEIENNKRSSLEYIKLSKEIKRSKLLDIK
ncbi:gamma carbonic anhydrase family protein [Clostridium sp. C2-6-12]|uniref:gamma carbonic anhydrase family protein n=1 Tax=Clostridium sp. C2-6-12 TaxID=2698832 RepID=UPI001367A188|nr:gamma carbonic anhydrase family protein [Clostridium sp. C2-6-12]